MLDSFFTNKIPSSSSEWTDELILVASIFNEFDGLPYEREAIIERFATQSNRVDSARDPADYRDEYGAYASFLGLMHFERQGDSWICRVSQNAKDLLCSDLPDPQSFVRLQMALMQYPNVLGAAYYENGTFRVEPNARTKRINQVQSGIRTVPFRLIIRVLLALHDNYESNQAYLSYPEIWHCLFTQPDAVGTFTPDGSLLAERVMQFRINPYSTTYNSNALRNLHVLKHTGLIDHATNPSCLILAVGAGNTESEIGGVARSIASMTNTYPVPSEDSSVDEIQEWTKNSLESGQWDRYYSGNNLTLRDVEGIVKSIVEVERGLLTDVTQGPGAPLLGFERERETRARRINRRLANQEETDALREKANLTHRALVKLLADRLRARDIIPESNIYVDLCCRVPEKMIFEVKSCRTENLLSQVRKGVSQLYEYRYRHEDLRGAELILALESRPTDQLEWLLDYLVKDRHIALCWLEGDSNLACPSLCPDTLGLLVNRVEQVA